MGSKWVLHMPTEGENQRKEAAKREYGCSQVAQTLLVVWNYAAIGPT